MGIISGLLKNMSGKASLSVTIGGSDVLDMSINGKDIIIDVKDPFALLDLGIEHLLKGGKSETIKKMKAAGFNIKLKYKMFKVEL